MHGIPPLAELETLELTLVLVVVPALELTLDPLAELAALTPDAVELPLLLLPAAPPWPPPPDANREPSSSSMSVIPWAHATVNVQPRSDNVTMTARITMAPPGNYPSGG